MKNLTKFLLPTLYLALVSCGPSNSNDNSVKVTPEKDSSMGQPADKFMGEGLPALSNLKAPEGFQVDIQDTSFTFSGGEFVENAGGNTGGMFIRTTDEFEKTASGGTIKLSVTASSANVSGTLLGLAYSTNDVGNSGWKWFDVTMTPQTFELEWDSPEMKAGLGDYVGFLAPNGEVQISKVKLEIK